MLDQWNDASNGFGSRPRPGEPMKWADTDMEGASPEKLPRAFRKGATRHQVEVEWNDTAVAYPRVARLDEFLQLQARRTPEAPALYAGEACWSYRELDAAANRLARHLQALGVGADSRVAVLIERSPEMVVALYAVQRAGGAYVPLDPVYPRERLEHMLRDSQASLLLTGAGLGGDLADAGSVRVVDLGRERAAIAERPACAPANAAGPGNLAYVLYTSGSTGKPKGVMISHGAICNRLLWRQHTFPLEPRDRVLQKAPYSFDASVWELFSPVPAGAALVLAGPGGHRDADELVETVLARGVTVLQTVPTALRLLLEARRLGECRSLERLFCGGEALPADLVERFRERLGQVAVVNLYGPTEVAINASYHPCRGAAGRGILPLGRPLANSRVHLLDRRGRSVPAGLRGELFVGGVGLARGYAGQARRTAERFLPDPLGPEAGQRLYRTGDLARQRPDGTIEFLGRFDHQVKVRGFRIELGEIEAVLEEHAAVRQAVVTARADLPGGEQELVAYALAGKERRGLVPELRAHLGERLPEHMVPARYVLLETLPRTPGGKVDRDRLPAPKRTRDDLAASYVAPRSAEERQLAAVWAEVLGLAEVGVEDDFFELGGHSLHATQVMSRVLKAFGRELPLSTLFEAPTVARFAPHLASAARPARESTVRRVARGESAPLSFAQQRMWFLDRLTPDNPFYVIPMPLRLRGPLRIPALEAALNEIVRRHEVLRTSFPAEDGRPYQRIARPSHRPLPVADLSALPAAARPREARRLAERDAVLPFDLARGLPVRFTLVYQEPGAAVLLLSFHHIASDGWSRGVFARELRELYQAVCRDRPAAVVLPELPIQYADFAVWQQEELRRGKRFAEQLGYWRRELAGVQVLELPTDRRRPAASRFRGRSLVRKLDAELTTALLHVSHERRATLFMTLLAAFQVLLHRLSGQDDVAVGSPIANRHYAELEDLIGFFVNTLVLRGDLAGDPAFAQLLAQAREKALAAYSRQDLPFEQLVEELRPERSLNRNPLFQVMLVVQNAPRLAADLGEVSARWMEIEARTVHFDLELQVFESRDGLDLHLLYDLDLFDRGTAERLLRQFRTLARAVAEDPSRRVSELPVLDRAALHQVQVEWSDTAAGYPRAVRVSELVERQARRTPEAPAVLDGEVCWSYRELDAAANRLAHHLRSLGLGAEDRVGVLLERSPEMVVALYAVWKAGGAYVPLDPIYPRERLEYMLEDSGAALLLTHGDLAADLGSSARAVDVEAAAGDGDRPPIAAAGPGHLAYVIYTSGSTGRPKGVQIAHRPLVNFLVSMAERPGFGAGDSLLAVTTICFDIAGLELFLPLLCGGQVVVASRETAADGRLLSAAVESSGASVVQATPATWRMLVESDWRPRRRLKALCGGEALPSELAAELLERGVELWNVYGPTETTVWSTLRRVDAPFAAGNAAIGSPIGNTSVHLVDRRLRAVGPGVLGELLIGGDGLSRGYLERPGLTAERFLPNPFDGAGSRLYRTGDLARRLPSGELEYLGRFDHQVKVRGFRIELGEIEAVLDEHAAVRQAVVVALDLGSGALLVAYVVPETDKDDLAPELRAHLGERLPDYMVPARYVFLEALPLTPNGKVDRKRLPAPDNLAPAAGYVAPRNPEEETLVAVWAEVLGLERVGVEDHFFELGGHSLLATQVISRVLRAFGRELPLGALFEAPTVARFAPLVAAVRFAPLVTSATPSALEPAIERVEGTSPPLSFAQQRMWFLDRLTPGNPFYIIPMPLRLRGPLDVPALKAALSEIVRRHEVLRTTFPAEEGRPRQRIAPPSPLPLPLADLAGLPAAARAREARRLADREAALAFDLARDLPLRLTLLVQAPNEALLLLSFHHVAADGWSFGVFSRELRELYRAVCQGRPARGVLEELPIQYADFAAWQRRELLEGKRFEGQLAYWRRELADVAVLELPTDRPRPAVSRYRGRALVRELGGELTAALRRLSHERQATPFMTLLAAFQILLRRWSGQTDVAVGSPIANRHYAEIEGLIGLFVNTLVLRGDLAGDPSFEKLLGQAREKALAAYAHQDVPFEKLVDELRTERSLNQSPLFQVMLAVQNASRPAADLGDVSARWMEASVKTVHFDCELVVLESPEGLRLKLVYDLDLFDRTTAERLLRCFRTLLSTVVTEPAERVSELALLEPAALHQLKVEWNDTALADPRAVPVSELIELQARGTPESTALWTREARWSYRELDEAAGRLARRLLSLGVAAEDRVGVLMERSPEMVAALLAIWKAGGAYVPLDPNAPSDRQEYMLRDSGVALLLTHGAVRERFASPHVFQVDVDEALAGASDPVAGRAPHPEQTAYVIYTSGSTGRPKGVPVAHRALARHCLGIRERYALCPDDRVLQFAATHFDASLEQLLVPLVAGGGVVLPEGRGLWSPEEMGSRIEEFGLTVLDLPPAYWQQMVREWIAVASPPVPERLRLVLLGGEAMSAEALRLWQETSWGAAVRVLNAYGPTEAVITATTCDASRRRIAARVPIGRPPAERTVRLVDWHARLVPIGVGGELCLGGVSLARGYQGRPRTTAERFVPDPWSARPGARLYRTGDLARHLPDGNVDFLGRLDRQVKVRGFRIELGEIEAVLEQHPAVRESVVLAREDGPGEKRLVGYLVAEPEPAIEELQSHLRQKLPAYMVPAAFVFLKALPLTPTGKVDLRALPAPEAPQTDLDEAQAAPRTGVEKQLAEIWAGVLGVGRVGIHDNFFALGGDSILTIQVVARANTRGLGLTPRDLFEHQTVAELSSVARTGASRVEAEQGRVVGEVPLTPIQHWFFERESLDPHHFNQAMLFELRERWTPARWRRALRSLTVHHDALRLRLVRQESGWEQTNTGGDGTAELLHLDCSRLSESAQKEALEAVATPLRASLDLSSPLLLRAALVERGPSRPNRLLMVIHHLAVDGVSWRILAEDLEALLTERELPPKTTSYREWACGLVAHVRSGALAAEEAHWVEVASRRTAPFPRDRSAGANTWASARTVTAALDPEETRALLQDVPSAYRTQINDVLLAALAETFSQWTGSRSLLLDLEGHGREDLLPGADLSRTVGWFTSIFPVFLDLGETEGPGEVLKSVKEELRAIPNRGVGYGLLRYLGDGETFSAAQESELSFNYLGQFSSLEGSSPLRRLPRAPGAFASPRDHRRYLLEIDGSVAAGRLEMTWTYSENRHRRATVCGLAESFFVHLRKLIDHCRSPQAGGYTPSDFPLVRLRQAALDRLSETFPTLEDVYPLTPIQQGLLFHSLDVERGEYLVQALMTLRGDLNELAFEKAWQRLVLRHPTLRTTVAVRGLDEPVQLVHAEAGVSLDRRDWTDLPAAARERELQALLDADRRQGFDLENGPLTRLVLLRWGATEYRFLWSHHHISLDGWSAAVLVRELFRFYGALRRGEEPSLPPPRPYRDYLVWLERQDLSAAETYWREALRGFDAPTPLGSAPGRVRPEEDQGVCRTWLDAASTEALRDAARRRRLTLGTVIQGAWALLLGRSCGQDDVVFGLTSSGRPAELEGIESMVGLFIATLPVRATARPQAALAAWLADLQEGQIRQRQYEYAPLTAIHGWSEVPRSQPLFESLLIVENYPVDPAADLELGESLSFERTHYPLTLEVAPESRLRIKLAYQTSRFGAADARRLGRHLRNLMEDMAARPQARVGDLSILTRGERHQLLVEWNETAAAYPGEACLHELLAAQAARTPEAIALTFEDESLTYRELDRRAGRLAGHLQALGVGPEVRVGLCVERSPELPVALLGILKAGGAYVPLDPIYPRERLEYMLEDSGAALVLTRGELGFDSPVRAVDLEAIAGNGDGALPTSAGPDNLAYVIYTSGSTGRPKGVQIAHRPLVNFLVSMAERPGLGAGDTLVAVTTICFDIAGLEIFLPLLYGGRVVMASREVAIDARQLAATLESSGASVMQATPATWRMLVESDWRPKRRLKVLCGGEALPSELAADLLERGVELWNVYGPTETTVWSTVRRVDAPFPGGVADVGRPIANTSVHLLDGHLRTVGVGVPGELLIGGDGLSRGYLGRPGLTAERFVPDPFAVPGSRLYRTGDLARRLGSGEVEYLGRFDHQVKVRGFRIELGEIEAVLEEHAAVRQAVVTARDDLTTETLLVAYLVSSDDDGVVPELRAHLRESLPDYMVPSRYVFLEALPLTPNGKVDRKRLPAPGKVERGVSRVAPRNEEERLLAAVWAEVLGLDEVGVEDDFFELGGHSLFATQVISRVWKVFGRELPPRLLFEAPTVARLAAAIAAAAPADPEHAIEPVPRDEGTELPLSFAQQRMWFLDRLTPDNPFYVLPMPLLLTGPLDVAALGAALAAIVRRHEVLRTSIPAVDGEPRLHIAPDAPRAFSVADLSGLPAAAREREARRLAGRDAALPFDLERDLPIRYSLLYQDPNESVLLLSFHHVVVDRWALGVFLRELVALYRGDELEELPIQYADFAAWQQQALSEGGRFAAQLGYWRRELDGVAVLELPTDRRRPVVSRHRGGDLVLGLDAELIGALRQLGQERTTTLFMTLLAAFQALLHRLSGQDDVAVGSPIANRNRTEVEDLIGLFVNTLVLRGDLDGDPPWEKLLEQAREKALAAYAHQDLPFEKLVEELQPERSLNRNPLFQVMLVVQNAPETDMDLGEVEVRWMDVEVKTSLFDLELHVFEESGELRLDLIYDLDLFDRGTAERVLRSFRAVLRALTADPACRISELPLHEAAALRQLKAERAPAPKKRARRAGYVAPRTPEEEKLAAIWAEVLGLERVGVLDHFFELGGHSLLATRVISRVLKAFGRELPLRALFEAPTVARFAPRVATAQRPAPEAAIRPAPRDVPPPLSFAQQRMWFLDRLVPDNPFYVVPMPLRLEGPLDVAALGAALNEIVRRHEALRTTISTEAGRPYQRIAPPTAASLAEVPLPVVDLSGLPAAARASEARVLAEEDAAFPFDLERDLPVRFALASLGPNESVLLVAFHHVAADAWSLGVFLRELRELYLGGVLVELPIQYADFAVWQQQELRGGERFADQLASCLRELDGVAVLELPTDRPRPPVSRFVGRALDRKLDGDLTEALHRLGRRHGATLFMTLLAAFQTLLQRLSGQDDVAVGSPIANRHYAEIEDLIGLFLNTLVLRGDLAGDPSFEELLEQAKEKALAAFARQDVPFEQLVEKLQPQRILNQNPLFQVMLVVQNASVAPEAAADLGEVSVRWMEAEVRAAHLDLELHVFESPEGLDLHLRYDLDLFDPSTAERLLRQLRTVLRAAVEEPARRISDLPVLDRAAFHQVRSEWNDTAFGFPRAARLCDLLAEQARRTPEAASISGGEAWWSYRELDAAANRLAHHLRSLGVAAEDRIGILMERSPEMVAALYAVWKAGGAYVPLDPIYPRERIRYMLEDSGASLLLTHGELDRGLDTAARVVDLDGERDAIAGRPATAPLAAAGPDTLAYVIYTSGSTGRPKGVQIAHGPLVNFLASMAERPGFDAGDTLLAVTTICFDISGLELFLPLLRGGRVVVASREVAADARRLAEAVLSSEATVLQATPATWRMLVDVGFEPPPGLKALCGGEALPSDLASALLERRVELWNVYGPTETTIWSTVRRIDKPFAGGNASLGRPIGNTSVHLLDGRLRPVGAGALGELLIGGDGLSRGYLGRAGLTAERFLPDPFGVPGSRLYRTGDLVRRLVSGELEYLGRLDHQVKVRGFRIELGEIEATLQQHPGIRQCVVMARELRPGDQQLVAYVVGDGAVSTLRLRRVLRDQLPDYMIPSQFVTLEELPKTPNGKVDRKALRKLEVARQPRSAQLAAPRTPAEKLVAEIWQSELGIEQVGVQDNFFDLGGHSLQAMVVVHKIETEWDVRIPPRDLFQQTLGQLAATIDELRTEGTRPGAASSSRRDG